MKYDYLVAKDNKSLNSDLLKPSTLSIFDTIIFRLQKKLLNKKAAFIWVAQKWIYFLQTFHSKKPLTFSQNQYMMKMIVIPSRLNKSEFKELLFLATKQSHLIFNEILYKQIDGVAMDPILNKNISSAPSF